MRMQEEHDLADDLLVSPAGDDALGALRPDAGDFTQPCRLLLDQLEDFGPEGADQLGGVDRTDATDQPEPRCFSMPSSVLGGLA